MPLIITDPEPQTSDPGLLVFGLDCQDRKTAPASRRVSQQCGYICSSLVKWVGA